MLDALRANYRPEFLNRLDEMATFVAISIAISIAISVAISVAISIAIPYPTCRTLQPHVPHACNPLVQVIINPLGLAQLRAIAELQLEALQGRLATRRITTDY